MSESLPAAEETTVQPPALEMKGRQTDGNTEPAFTYEGLDDPDASEVKIAGFAARYDNAFLKMKFEDYEFWRVHMDNCFADSLAGDPDIYLARDHKNSFARTGAGTLRVENRPGQGVYFEGTVSKKNPEAMSMVVEMERGTLQEASIAYWIPDGGDEVITTEKDGITKVVQRISAAELDRGDVSVCLYGANPKAGAWLPREARETLVEMYPDQFPDLLEEAMEKAQNEAQEAEVSADGGDTDPSPEVGVLTPPNLGKLADAVLQWRRKRRNRLEGES